MPERFAIYFAPEHASALALRAEDWLAQGDLQPLTASARRYGFHATIKAPMALGAGTDRAKLEGALAQFSARHAPVTLSGLAPRLIDGFLALTTEPQPRQLTDFAATVVANFDRFRAPLSADDRARRLKAPLSARQIELLDEYGYPYALEEFQFHMTLSDRLPLEQRADMAARAADWFADALAAPIALDRLVLFHEAEPGAAFRRLDDYPLTGDA